MTAARDGQSGGNGKYRVLIADNIALEGLEPLRIDDRFELINAGLLQGDKLADALADVDAVIVRSAAKVPREVLRHADRLKIIGRAGVGVDTIDVDAATERGIAVLNAPSGNTISAAELAMALLMSVVRKVAAADRSMKAGKWDRAKFSGTELYLKTLGLIGAGRIGGEVAKRARGFGMRVLVYDPFLTDERARALGGEPSTLDELLRRSDAVTLHVPLTDGTRHMIGEAQLALMKPTAVLVNAARGGIVDEAALVRALSEKRLAGAALDVFEAEPLPADHPLRTLDSVVLTPHLGASTEEAQQNVAVEIAEAVRDALLAGDLSRAVNAPAVGGDEMRRLRPLLDLTERLGMLAAAMGPNAANQVEVRYAGSTEGVLRSLAASALVGVLSGVVGRTEVNFVNAPHLAKTRGIEVVRTKLDVHSDYSEYIEVRVAGKGGEGRAAGALLAELHPRVVRLGEYYMDVVPRGTLLILCNRDVPGVIGRVGTVLGDAGVNIGEYHQARRQTGGEALAAISIDSRLTAAVEQSLRALPEVIQVTQVQLD